MRAVWTLIALLVLAALGLWLRGAEPSVPGPAPIESIAERPDDNTGATSPLPPPTARHSPPSTAPPSPAHVAQPLTTGVDVVRRIDSRTVLLDDRFEVLGNGTEGDPYRVSWDLLGSAAEGMAPDSGSLVPPPWIASLDGSWIEVSGFVSTPVVTDQTRDVLFTKNRWDGCCIGIPPTPFDSLEVGLEQPFSFFEKHALRFGVLRGQLSVSPFLAAGVVLGIYRVEHGSFTTSAE